MQHRIITILLIVCTCALILPHASLSQEASTTEESATSTLPTLPLNFEVPKDEQERKEMRKVELRNRIAPQMKNRTKNLLENVTNRLSATVFRLEAIETRILSRIVKYEQAGYDTTEAKQAVERSKAALQNAQEGLVRITDLRMELIVDSRTPRQEFATLTRELQGIKDDLTTSRLALMSAVNVLSLPPQHNATSTSE